MSAKSLDSVPLTRTRSLWLAAVSIPVILQVLTNLLRSESDPPIGTPRTLFIIAIAMMALTAISSGMLLNRARRTGECELGYVGLFFFTITVLLLANALVTPDVLFASSDTGSATAFWAVPIALLVSVPAILGRTRVGLAIDAEWHQWTSTVQFTVVAAAALIVIFPQLLFAPVAGSAATNAVTVLSVIGCAIYSYRHYQLACIARSNGPLIVALGYTLIGGSMLTWLSAEPYSVPFWISHFLIMFGTIAGTVGALNVYQVTDHIRPFIVSIIAVDPRCALEVGVEPSVHTFLSELQQKDPISTDHIVRTTELALIVGPKLGLEGTELRDLGLTALLHDIGKVMVPESILTKPGELEDREYAIVKRHAQYGAEIAAASPALRSIAPAIRAHHEHIDGSGYPNGLVGPQVPLLARIVSVCDAFDALSNTRQYRPNLDREAAIEVLERRAGSLWDRRVVETVVRTVRHHQPRSMPERLDVVGRIGCDCIPRLAA